MYLPAPSRQGALMCGCGRSPSDLQLCDAPIFSSELSMPGWIRGRRLLVGIGVTVEECYVHCGKAFRRSKAWDPDSWRARAAHPDIPKMLADHARLDDIGREQVAEALKESYEHTLY